MTRIAAQAPRFSHGVSGWYWLLQFGIRILILVMYKGYPFSSTAFIRSDVALNG